MGQSTEAMRKWREKPENREKERARDRRRRRNWTPEQREKWNAYQREYARKRRQANANTTN